MLFRRDIEPNCVYCEYAERVNGERADDNAERVNGERADDSAERVNGAESQRVDDTGLKCVKRGTTTPESSCKAFRYDPLKRVPPRPASLRLGKFRESDFSL